MTDKEFSFAIHISDSNNEDVAPLIYNGWLAAADGMGGTGCMKHSVDKKYRSDLPALIKRVVPVYKQNNNDSVTVKSIDGECGDWEYLSKIFAPCLERDSCTSAMWASRVAMAYFLCAAKYYAHEIDWNDDESCKKYIRDLGEYIYDGLKNAKEKLHLTVSSPYMSVTPTTFASIHYSPLEDGNYLVLAVWAGDSRCYMLDKNGLRKLSQDDEDENKQLTNCFSADSEAELHYRKYVLRPPFALLCTSDGFFDAYDSTNISVEARLLEDIFKNSSIEELHAALVERYNNNLSDDTSIAFVGLGFEGYDQFKACLEERREMVGGLYKRYCEYSPVLSLIDKPEFQVTASICDRFETKFAAIIKLIVESYYSGKEDILLTQNWIEIIRECETECGQDIAARLEERRYALKQKVLERVRSQTNCAYLKKITHISGKSIKIIDDYRGCCLSLKDAEVKKQKHEQKLQELDESAKVILGDIWSAQEKLLKELTDTISISRVDGGDQIHNRRRIANNLKDLVELEVVFIKNKSVGEYENKTICKSLVSRIKKYIKNKKEVTNSLNVINKEISYLNREKEKAYKNIEENIDQFMDCRKYIFTDEFIAELDMENIMSDAVFASELQACVSEKLVAIHAKDGGLIETTLETFKHNPGATSCVDSLFSVGKLANFRKYYGCKNNAELPEYVKYREDINAYEQEMDQVIEQS